MASAKRTWRRHRGMTLVELLIVISIMVILLAVAIPMVRPAFKDRKLREAARQLNAFFTGAKARAAENGRPYGVWIQRVDGTERGSKRSVQVFYAEVGPNYTGATIGSKATLGPLLPPAIPGGPPISLLTLQPLDDAILRTMVERSEYFGIKFDYKGLVYSAYRTSSGPDVFYVNIPTGVLPPGSFTAPGLTYEITRTPIRSSVSPAQLPGDVAIDLSVSGVGTSGNQFDSGAAGPFTTAPVVIMFSPSGDVQSVYNNALQLGAYGPIHLLLGRVSKVVNPATTNFSNPEITEVANLSDPSNLWVTIGHRTGSVITSDNDDTSWVAAAAPLPARIRAARAFARRSIRKGGR